MFMTKTEVAKSILEGESGAEVWRILSSVKPKWFEIMEKLEECLAERKRDRRKTMEKVQRLDKMELNGKEVMLPMLELSLPCHLLLNKSNPLSESYINELCKP